MAVLVEKLCSIFFCLVFDRQLSVFLSCFLFCPLHCLSFDITTSDCRYYDFCLSILRLLNAILAIFKPFLLYMYGVSQCNDKTLIYNICFHNFMHIVCMIISKLHTIINNAFVWCMNENARPCNQTIVGYFDVSFRKLHYYIVIYIHDNI